MLLSSLIVFAAVALLASASDNHNQRSNSLWRRVNKYAEDNTGGPSRQLSGEGGGSHHNGGRSDGPRRQPTPPPPPSDDRLAVLFEDRDPHGRGGITHSRVTFSNGEYHDFQLIPTPPWERPLTQHHGPNEQPPQHIDYTFDEIHYPHGFYGRTFYENGQLMLTLLFRDTTCERRRVFYSPRNDPSQHGHHTTRQFIMTHGSAHEFIQLFLGPDGQEMLSFRRCFNGTWRMTYHTPILWRTNLSDPPHQP